MKLWEVISIFVYVVVCIIEKLVVNFLIICVINGVEVECYGFVIKLVIRCY